MLCIVPVKQTTWEAQISGASDVVMIIIIVLFVGALQDAQGHLTGVKQ